MINTTYNRELLKGVMNILQRMLLKRFPQILKNS